MIGESLFNAAAIMVKAGAEIDAMLEILRTLIKELADMDSVSKIKVIGTGNYEGNDWVSTGMIQNFAFFKQRARSRATAYLGIKISLCDDAESEITGKQPLLYVLFWADDEAWEFDDFDLAGAAKQEWELENDCWWQGVDETDDRSAIRPWDQVKCVWVLPLVELNTPVDLREAIVNPLKAIIDGEPFWEILASSDKVLKFKVIGSNVELLKNAADNA